MEQPDAVRETCDAAFVRSGAVSLAIALAVGSPRRAATADTRLPDLGVRIGFAGQTHHGGRTSFSGGGLDLGIEAGLRVTPDLVIRLGYERAPRLVDCCIPYGSDGDTERHDIAIVGIAELHRDRFFIGAGAGWVHESNTEIIWGEDNLGPTGPDVLSTARDGELVLVRGGMRAFTAARISGNLVMQLTAQRVTGPAHLGGPFEHTAAYGASVGVELRGPVVPPPAAAPRD